MATSAKSPQRSTLDRVKEKMEVNLQGEICSEVSTIEQVDKKVSLAAEDL